MNLSYCDWIDKRQRILLLWQKYCLTPITVLANTFFNVKEVTVILDRILSVLNEYQLLWLNRPTTDNCIVLTKILSNTYYCPCKYLFNVKEAPVILDRILSVVNEPQLFWLNRITTDNSVAVTKILSHAYYCTCNHNFWF